MEKVTRRIEAIVMQAVLTTYNDKGEPINEEQSQPIKVFRAAHMDIWAHLDDLLAATPSGV